MESNLLVVKTTKRNPDTITVDISDEACKIFGFCHNDIVKKPDGILARIEGVAPGNDGENVLWYEIQLPATRGKVCYWSGEKNLVLAGFKKVA